MTEENICPSCHRPLPPDAPGGLCPACVLMGAREEALPPGLPDLDQVRAAFPQFEILECIGRGGMGAVYKARQPQLDRIVALKILLPGLERDPGFAERFAREARALAKLNHPNIVAVHDFGESGGFFWLTMEYVDGVNLRQAMQAARFTPAQALAIIPELCSALQYAHDQGILHRDIKPENILLDARGKVKVADFGIARMAGDERLNPTLTMTGAALGTTAYIAPEQIENPRAVDHRADLYSLGVVLYEMLTGELPLGRFPAPSERSASDPRLDEVVFRTLEKEREKRYQTADEVRHGVETAYDRPAKVAPVEVGSSSSTLIAVSIGSILVGAILMCFGVPMKELLLTVPGLCFAVLGIAGGWWALWRIKRGTASTAGYAALRIFAVWLPVLTIAGFLIMFHMDQGARPFHGKGDYFVNLATLYVFCFVIARLAFVLSGLPAKARPRKPWATGAVAALALGLAAVSLLVAKRRDGHWPDAYFMAEKSFYLQEPSSWKPDSKGGPSPVEAALREAAGEYRDKISISREQGRWKIAMLAKNPEAGKAHFQAYLARVLVTLPLETQVSRHEIESTYAMIGMIHPVFLTERGRYPVSEIDVGCLIPAAASAVLAAWCLAPWSLLLAGLSLAAGAGLAAAPLMERADSKNGMLIEGPPLPPLERRVPPADFSTPVKAAQSVFDAAWAGDMETMKQGISLEWRRKIDGQDKWPIVMKYLSSRTLVGLLETPFLDDPARALISTRSLSSESKLGMRQEDGEWRLDGMPFDLIGIR